MSHRCTKCGGPNFAERDITGRIESVRCLNCGERLFRDFVRRFPTDKERAGNITGIPVYKPTAAGRRARSAA